MFKTTVSIRDRVSPHKLVFSFFLFSMTVSCKQPKDIPARCCAHYREILSTVTSYTMSRVIRNKFELVLAG